MTLELFQPVEWGSTAILELRDHRGRGRVVFFRTYSFRFLCGKHLSAGTAAQPLQRVDSGRQRRLPNNPHQHFRLFLPVYVAFLALRAAIPVLQLWVRNRNLPRTAKRLCTIAPMSGRGRSVALRLSLDGRFHAFRLSQHGAGLLRAASSTRSSSSRLTSTRRLAVFILVP